MNPDLAARAIADGAVLDRLDPHRTALLLIHWQRDVVLPTGGLGGHFGLMVERSGVVPRLAGLVAAARGAGVHVVYANVGYEPDGRDIVTNGPVWSLVKTSGALRQGTPGTENIPELAPEAGDLVIRHGRISVFADTGLEPWLRGRDVTTLLVAGVATNVAVEGSARSANDAGFSTVLVEDCCAAATPEAHAASVATMRTLLSQVTTAAAATAALQVTPSAAPRRRS